MYRALFFLAILSSFGCTKDGGIFGCEDITIVITNDRICDADITLNGVDYGELEAGHWKSVQVEPGFYSLSATFPSLLCGSRSYSATQNECGGTLNFLID